MYYEPYKARHRIGVNQNDDPSSKGYADYALKILRHAVDLLRNSHEPSCRRDLMAYEHPLRDRKDILLSQLDGEDPLAHIERGAQVAMILAWLVQEQKQRKSDGKTILLPLHFDALLVCKKMLPIAHQHYRAAPHLYYDLLLSEAELQFADKDRLILLRRAARGVHEVRNRNHRAWLYGRIALMYFEYFGAKIRGSYWWARAMLVYCSAEVRDEIARTFYR